MASDIALSLREIFITSFELSYSSLPAEFNALLVDIKAQLNNGRFEEAWTHENISTLYHLDEAMAECKLFTMEKKGFLKSLSGAVRRPDDELKEGLKRIKEDITDSIKKATSLAPPTYPTGRHTYPDPIKSPEIIVGFDGYKEKILGMLLSPSRDGFIGIGIHGMCGTGKTTLVKYVLQDLELRDRFKPQKSDVDPKSKSNVQEESKLQDSDVDSTSKSNVGDKFKLPNPDVDPKSKSSVQEESKLQDSYVDSTSKSNVGNKFKPQNSDVDPKSKSNVQEESKSQDSDVDSTSKSNVGDKFKPQNPEEFKLVWVCLSDITSPEELDTRIVKYILEELGQDTDEWTAENPSLTDVGLLEKLREKLHELRNYIIVLDDLWHCNDWFGKLMVEADGSQRHKRFSHIFPRFRDGGGVGAVIVTTRIKKVAEKMVGEQNLIHLKPLDEKKEFMKKLVNRTEGLKNQVDEVAHHCHGLPFVATMSNLVDEHILPKEQETTPKEVGETADAPPKQQEATPKEGGETAEAPGEKSAKDQPINSDDGQHS